MLVTVPVLLVNEAQVPFLVRHSVSVEASNVIPVRSSFQLAFESATTKASPLPNDHPEDWLTVPLVDIFP
jgi:hypothetical protein